MTRPFDANAHLEAASQAVDLEVPDEYRDGVVRFLTIAADMAATLDDVPVNAREATLAPIYTPPETDE